MQTFKSGDTWTHAHFQYANLDMEKNKDSFGRTSLEENVSKSTLEGCKNNSEGSHQ